MGSLGNDLLISNRLPVADCNKLSFDMSLRCVTDTARLLLVFLSWWRAPLCLCSSSYIHQYKDSSRVIQLLVHVRARLLRLAAMSVLALLCRCRLDWRPALAAICRNTVVSPYDLTDVFCFPSACCGVWMRGRNLGGPGVLVLFCPLQRVTQNECVDGTYT